MTIENIGDFCYPRNSRQTIYDSEELTALELAARSAYKINEIIGILNNGRIDPTAIVVTDKDYGALGNSTNGVDGDNDSYAIQAAIDKAGAYGRVYFPNPGNGRGYKITQPIYLKQGQRLEGAGLVKIFDMVAGDWCFKVIGGSAFATNAITHISMSNFEFAGNSSSYGAIKLVNVYIMDFEHIKIQSYSNASAKAFYIEDFFQINLKTVQVNSIANGTGLYVNAVTGNAGQLNLFNTIVQRCNVALDIIGTGNLLDGVAMYGGAIGNNYNTGIRIGKNVYNVSFYGCHIENHDGILYSGTKAVDMVLGSGLECEGIGFYHCLFINNKYGISSNNAKRVVLLGNEFDSRSISGNVAITQGAGDVAWFIGPQKFVNVSTNLIEAGVKHVNFLNFFINNAGSIFPSGGTAGIYTGAGFPSMAATVGSIYMRTDGGAGNTIYFKYSGTDNTGWISIGQPSSTFTTAGRPGADTLPIGSRIYDTTLSLPLWTNGTSWRKADGTAG